MWESYGSESRPGVPKIQESINVPSGYVKLALENGYLKGMFLLNMVMFNSYVTN